MLPLIQPTQKVALEIEFKYLLQDPAPKLLQQLALSPIQKFIAQYHFSRDLSQAMLLPIMRELCPEQIASVDATRLKGRVRKLTVDDQVKYILGLKGPKDEAFKRLNIVSKPEIEAECTEAEFKKLKRNADKGYIIKQRTVVPCTVLHEGTTYQLQAEFDKVTTVNGYHLRPNFLIMEIEVPEENSTKIIQAVRKGIVTLHLLDMDLNLDTLNKIEIPIDCAEDYADLMASSKLVENIHHKHGPVRHLKKFFDLA